MLGHFPEPRFMPCPDCGGSVDRAGRDAHVCEQSRWLDYQVFQLRELVASFETDFHAYMASPHGKFELWYAEYLRRSRR